MFKFLCVVMLMLMLASCVPNAVEIPNTANPIQNVDNPGTTLNTSRSNDAPEWIETDINGVDLGVWVPGGWQYDDTAGLTLVEHMGSIDTGAPASGISIYFFVPELDGIVDQNRNHANLAYAALRQVARSPELIGGAQVSSPVQVKWGEVDAAYYTFTAPSDVQGWVIAFAVPNDDKILVTNITAPQADLNRLQDILPALLNDLRINRERLGEDAADLSALLTVEEREAG